MIEPGTVFIINKALLDTYADIMDTNIYGTDITDDKPIIETFTDQETMKEIRNLNYFFSLGNLDSEFPYFVENATPLSFEGMHQLWAQIEKQLPIDNHKKYAEFYELFGHRLKWSPTKIVLPVSIQLMEKEQKLIYLKQNSDENKNRFHVFQYDGANIRFGDRFMSFLRLCKWKQFPGFKIDNVETYSNNFNKTHEKLYEKAVEDAKALRKERMELAEVNAEALSKYFFPTQHVRAKYDWRFFLTLPWIIFKNLFFNLTPKRREK